MLESMIIEDNQYETSRIDHLGIVAGICQRINLVEVIDGTLPSPVERKVSCGQAIQAMVLNAMGLTSRALYLMPEYMANKPVELLIGEGLKAEDFNDDTLGRALDEVQQAGITEMFASIAAEAMQVYDLKANYVHVDSSSFSLQGEYDSEYARNMAAKFETVKITHGYSKDMRPDLKQVVVNLITTQASSLPIWLEALDGNSSDQTSFRETITTYCKQLKEGEEIPWFVFDSAGYTQKNLQTWEGVNWITRVPETINEAKDVVRSVSTEEMKEIDKNYKGHSFSSSYGKVKQRWLLVYSKAAQAREEKQYRKRLQKKKEAIIPKWKKLCRLSFNCQDDAKARLLLFEKDAKLHEWEIRGEVVPIKKYGRRGRPAPTDQPKIVGWQIEGELVLNEEIVASEVQWLGRFVLATNILDEQVLSDEKLLACYKEQSSSVERGFRFLKDPLFFADSLFVKSPVRVMAMIMVMGVALLVYSLAELELQQALKEQNETIPDQKGKPTQKITMRRVAQIFEGVDVLTIRDTTGAVRQQILNLTPVRLKILRLFNPFVHNCYLLDFSCGM